MKVLCISCMFFFLQNDCVIAEKQPGTTISKRDSRRVDRAIKRTFVALRKRKLLIP